MDEIIALGSAPIPGEAPGGASIRYEDVFTRLEAEIAKLENPAGGEVDWATVASDCRAVLGERSKDFLLAAWLGRALYERQRLPGLAAGLQVIAGLIANFWDVAFPQPPRIKPRRAALEWLSEKLAAILDPHDAASPQGREALAACQSAVAGIFAATEGRFEGEDCGLTALRRRLGELAGPPEAAAEAQAETPTEEAAPAEAATGRSAKRGISSRNDAISRLHEVAEWFTRNEPHSPIGFLAARAVAWNAKTFQEVFAEILKGNDPAQQQVWDALGVPPPAPPAQG